MNLRVKVINWLTKEDEALMKTTDSGDCVTLEFLGRLPDNMHRLMTDELRGGNND